MTRYVIDPGVALRQATEQVEVAPEHPRLSKFDMSSNDSYSVGMKAVVSEKGQVTIPKRLRERLGLRPGTVLDFDEDRGRLVARKVIEDDVLERVWGILELDVSVDELIEEMRGPGPEVP